jgi:radical SAM superfamily enzyme YgiQ (UPF0313 family)
MKTIVVYNPARYNNEVWLPALWSQAKTYYETHGIKKNQWHWAPCIADIHSDDFEKTKLILEHIEPDVFAVSLYVWNYVKAHRVAAWVKQRWPNCLVVTGGPQQNFKYNHTWFQKHPCIDVSLPGECYGELFLTEILDNICDDGTVDFNLLTDACYPLGQSKFPTYSQKRSNISIKKTFAYDFASFADQIPAVTQFVNYCQTQIPNVNFFAMLETTRGCPYGCTYCDWGGGISTAVLQKDVDVVDRDLEFLCQLELKYLYVADANFGIFGERDVHIMKTLINHRRRTNNHMKLGYGGWAKTENKLPYIRELITLDIKNDLSNSKEIKISMQSLDAEILKNIDRKNIELDRQLEFLQPLSQRNRMPLYVELIMGLPGMTMEKFYKEISILGERNLSVMWYEWLLLPETPAYDPEYRRRFGIGTVNKQRGWAWHEVDADREIVVESSSYSRGDYLKMLLSAGLYNGIIQGGMYQNSLRWIMKNQSLTLGDIICNLIEQLQKTCTLDDHWGSLLENPNQTLTVDVAGQQVYVLWYWVAQVFFHPAKVNKLIKKVLVTEYLCPEKIFEKDCQLLLTVENFGQQHRRGLWKLDYRSSKSQQNPWDTILGDFLAYKNSGNVMCAQKKFLY